MLEFFRSQGMTDLNFMIVNTKHSRVQMPLLRRRVSFDVLQETEEEPVWNTLGGGKDDMYVYDRCGRLAHYIPFPQSIISAQQMVVAVRVMETYLESRCGAACDAAGNETAEATIASNTTRSSYENETITADYIDLNNENATVGNASLLVSNDTVLTTPSNASSVGFNDTDASEHIHNNDNNSESTNPDNTNSLRHMYLGSNNISGVGENSTVGASSITENNEMLNDENSLVNDIMFRQNLEENRRKTMEEAAKKSDRCAEADLQVCQSWSKQKLVRAQKCCSNSEEVPSGSCSRFGKRRCKKLKSILKCCAKTFLGDGETITTTTETTTVTETEEAPVDVVCCKTVENGRLCRVLPTASTCDDDETVQENQTG